MSRAIEIGMVGEVEEDFDLTAPGVIEDLTKQGRLVTFQYGLLDGKKVATAWVPPETVSFGDKEWPIYGGGSEFFSGRTSLGVSTMINLSEKDGKRLMKIRNETQEQIGRHDEYWYKVLSIAEYDELTQDREHRYFGDYE